MSEPSCPACATPLLYAPQAGDRCLACRAALASGSLGGWIPPARREARPALEPLPEGRYLAEAELGRGGSGVVYLARDQHLGRKVALKVLFEANAGLHEQRDRFEREARMAARFDHPGLVRVHDVGSQGERRVIAMEVVPGPSLRDVISRCGALPPELAARWIEQAASAVAVAHAAGVIHRDLKPENLLLDASGRVVVTDFGIAFAADAEGTRLTATGALLGTPAYLAPEQLEVMSEDARVDVYGLGVVLYELLTGRAAYPEPNAVAVISAMLRGPPPPLLTLRKDCPLPLARIVERAMERRPEDRYPDARSLASDLDDWLRGARVTVDLPTRRRARWRWAGVTGAVLAVLVAAAGLFALWDPQAAREAEAVRRRDLMEERTARLRAEGQEAAAAEVFQVFTEMREVAGTAALATAWREEGRRRAERGDAAGARTALARSYEAAGDPAEAQATLLQLGELLRREWNWSGLDRVVRTLRERGAGREKVDPLASAVAWARRDLALALATDPDPPGPGWQAAQPLGPVPERAVRVPGAAEALLFSMNALEVRWVNLDRDLTERARWTFPDGTGRSFQAAALPDGEGGLFYLGGFHQWGGGAVVLWRLRPATAPEPLLKIPDAVGVTVITADLDGDGRPSFLVGTGPYDRRLIEVYQEGDRWSWRQPSPRVDATKSDVVALLPWEVDGDPGEELLVAQGAWQAFDLRWLDLRPPELVMTGRRKVGVLHDLARVRSPGGDRIATLHMEQLPSRESFPADRPYGEPPGLLLFDPQLGLTDRLPLGTSPGVDPLRLVAADLDGDGFDEVVAWDDTDEVVISRVGDRPKQWAMEGVQPLLAYDVDGDSAEELLVRLDLAEGYWMGVGEGALPMLPLDPPGPRPAPRLEPALESIWRRVEELVAMGLWEDSARAFERLARLAETEAAAQEAWSRAGEMWQSAGRSELAERAWQQAAPFPPAIEREVSYLLDHGRALDARERAALLPAGVSLSEPLAARLAAVASASRWEVDLRQGVPAAFGRQHLAWVAPSAEGLTLTTFGDDPRLLAARVQCDGGLLGLRMDGRFLEADWSSGVSLELVDEAGRLAAGLTLMRSGGGGHYKEEIVCRESGGSYRHLFRPDAEADGWLELSADGPIWRCGTGRDGSSYEREERRPAFAAGTYELRLGWSRLVSAVEVSQARTLLRSLRVAGCAPLPAEPEPVPAFAQVWPERLDQDRLVAALRATRSEPGWEQEILRGMRADLPRFYTAAVDLLGQPTADDLAQRAWEVPLLQHPDRPDVREALIQVLRPTEARAVLIRLTHLARSGRDAEALAELRRLEEGLTGETAARAALTRALIYGLRRDEAAARAAVEDALRHAPAPEVFADRVRALPELAPWTESPAWSALLEAVGAGPPLGVER